MIIDEVFKCHTAGSDRMGVVRVQNGAKSAPELVKKGAGQVFFNFFGINVSTGLSLLFPSVQSEKIA